MKNAHCPCVFLLAFLVIPIAFSQNVLIGTNEYAVIFEDNTLPQDIRGAISTELTEAFSYGTEPADIYETRQEGNVEFGHLLEQYTTSSPSVLWDGVCFTNLDNSVKCYVWKTLSVAYTNRVARYGNYSQERQSLRELINVVNSDSFTNLTLQAKADCFWHGGTVPADVSQTQIDAFEEEVVPLLRDYTIFPPSIFRLDGPTTVEGDTASLYGWCIFVSKQGNPKRISAAPVGYVDGKWRFFFGLN